MESEKGGKRRFAAGVSKRMALENKKIQIQKKTKKEGVIEQSSQPKQRGKGRLERVRQVKRTMGVIIQANHLQRGK